MEKSYPRSDGVILYKDTRGVTHWKLYPRSKDNVERNNIMLSLLNNRKVANESILIIPFIGLTGCVWLYGHDDQRADCWDLYRQFDMKFKPEKISCEIERAVKESTFESKPTFGFIRPDGKHFGCAYQGHSRLASSICYGTIDTNNPERYLEEHGWCKIMKSSGIGYFVYLNDRFKITKEQFHTLQQLGIEHADGVNDILKRG